MRLKPPRGTGSEDPHESSVGETGAKDVLMTVELGGDGCINPHTSFSASGRLVYTADKIWVVDYLSSSPTRLARTRQLCRCKAF